MKVSVIGGGSSYTPELVDGLYKRLHAIPVTEVTLMDLDRDRLAIVAGLTRRMGDRYGAAFDIHETTDLDEAVAGAKYVVTQIRVGGSRARVRDEQLGRRHGLLGQETTGVGGFANALRTIPRVLEVARAMESSAPDGSLINFTNPAGIVTEAVIKHSPVRTVGLCNIPIGMLMDIVQFTGCELDAIKADYIGLNHLSWVRGFRIGGEDRTAEILAAFIGRAGEEWADPAVCQGMQSAMRRLGMWCNPYLQYYYCPEATLARQQAQPKTRGEEVIEIEQALFDKYRRSDLNEKPAELSLRGGAHYSTAALRLVEAMESDGGNVQIVCCRNGDAIPTFDAAAALEVPAHVGADGATAIEQSPPQPAIGGLMQLVKSYESLTVEAAVSGDREAACMAIMTNPLMPGAERAEALLDDLLEINREHLQGTFF